MKLYKVCYNNIEEGKRTLTKLKGPILSFNARNSLSKAISFVRRRGQNIAEKKPEIKDVRSLAQLSWRHMYLKAVALWHALSSAEQAEWESSARPRHMTGFAWFMSQALKPNPGLYLPLQGGTMSGDIDMAKNRLLKLPVPTDAQEAASKTYVDTLIAASLYNEGCFVHGNSSLDIPTATPTFIPWNLEEYDTDSIHSIIANTDRLTCQTAGKYIVSLYCTWAASGAGIREMSLHKNVAATHLCENSQVGEAGGLISQTSSRLLDLIVGDYLRARVNQNSGAGLAVHLWARYSGFGMQRVGE